MSVSSEVMQDVERAVEALDQAHDTARKVEGWEAEYDYDSDMHQHMYDWRKRLDTALSAVCDVLREMEQEVLRSQIKVKPK